MIFFGLFCRHRNMSIFKRGDMFETPKSKHQQDSVLVAKKAVCICNDCGSFVPGTPRAVFIGYQPTERKYHAFALFNIIGFARGEWTVCRRTLRRFGIPVPKIPSLREWKQ